MTDGPLKGIGVVVTRPEVQTLELATEIERLGGQAIRLPLLEIVPRNEILIAKDMAALPVPDIAVFVSANAVEFGLKHIPEAPIAAIGPTTAAAITTAGRNVDISARDGFDSESLLASAELIEVAGKHVVVVRGGHGRALLADTLRKRGATVSFLDVYERTLPEITATSMAALESAWRNGGIDALVVMSVQTLINMDRVLPAAILDNLSEVILVTPSTRVIKEVLERYPESQPVLASGPQVNDIIAAILTTRGPGRKTEK